MFSLIRIELELSGRVCASEMYENVGVCVCVFEGGHMQVHVVIGRTFVCLSNEI